jgi:hypothetical protein
MKKILLFILIIISSGGLFSQVQKGDSIKQLPYPLEAPDMEKPEPFAPYFFSEYFDERGLHTIIIFSQDGKEAYWRAFEKSGKEGEKGKCFIFTSVLENNKWKKPEPAAFSLPDMGDDAPCISPDGKKIFFISMRSGDNQKNKSDEEKIWYAERSGSGWSEPKLMPAEINSLRLIHWGISVDNRNNLYFGVRPSMDLNDGYYGDVYYSENRNGQYTKSVKMPDSVNIPGFKFSPFISADGSYILFTHIGDKDDHYKIMISFKKEDGIWTKAKEINPWIKMDKQNILNASVTPDGKHIIFHQLKNKRFLIPYWIKSSFIEEMKKGN